MSWRTLLANLPEVVAAPDLPDALAALEKVRLILTRRYMNGGAGDSTREAPAQSPPAPAPDRLLTAEQVAEVLGVSTDYVYRQAGKWRFAKKLGPKVLRFSEAGLQRWLASR